tara:strand:- start:249 stop:1022 length:774 start_codon:yes stop_codon:yes gene_type:complete
MTVKYEVITLITATETYGDVSTKKGKALREKNTALNHILPILEKNMESICTVIDYFTKDYTLVPRRKEEKEVVYEGKAALLIEELELFKWNPGVKARAENTLRRGNLSVIGEVLERTPKELLGLHGFAAWSLYELFDRLNELGFPINDHTFVPRGIHKSMDLSDMPRDWEKRKLIDLIKPNEEDTVDQTSTVYSTGGEEEEVDISSFSTRSFAPDDDYDDYDVDDDESEESEDTPDLMSLTKNRLEMLDTNGYKIIL